MDQLIRETQPPVGRPRSPVPQYWNPDTEKYERVLGVHGAPRAMLYGPNGQPISTSNRLPVDVGAQVATESTLATAVSRLNAILTRLEGTLDVDVGGQIHADVALGDVTVQIGEVQQGKRGQNAEPWEVTLKGSSVLHELVWNPTPGIPAWRVFGETAGDHAQAIKPFDASRLAILYVRVINQSGASLWAFGPPHPDGIFGTVGLFYGSLDAQAGIPNPKRLLDVAHGIPYETPNGGVLTIRLSDCIGADAGSEDAYLLFPRYGAAGVKLAVRARADNTGGPITVQFIGGSVS